LSPHGSFFGARVQWTLDPLFAVEAYALARWVQDNPPQSLADTVRGQTYTGSLRLHGEEHGRTWGAEGAYQLATSIKFRGGAPGAPPLPRPGTSRMPSRASYCSRSCGLALPMPTVTTVAPHTGHSDALLPDVHQWHGAMDLFAWSNEAVASVRAFVTPATDVAGTVEYRYAQLADAGGPWATDNLVTVGAAPGNAQRALGHEIDGDIEFHGWGPLELAVGYSMLVLGDGARAILAANRFGGRTPPLAHFAFAHVALRLP
jgi:hypothetical protein